MNSQPMNLIENASQLSDNILSYEIPQSSYAIARDIFQDLTDSKWTSAICKLDQDSKTALLSSQACDLFVREIEELNELLATNGRNFFIVDICHDQSGNPGIVSGVRSRDGGARYWVQYLRNLQEGTGNWVEFDGKRWVPSDLAS
jgi:hypothetical protein